MVEVIHLRNPNALSSPDFRAFLKRSVKRGSLLDEAALIQGLLARLPDPGFAALVGVEKGVFQALSLISLPANSWQPQPYVQHFYNGGSAALRDALVKATVDFVVQAGYTTFIAVNLVDRGFDAWAKTFRKAGETKVIGQLVEFKVD